jgi:hypothetical protein
MGTPGIVRLVAVPADELVASTDAGPALVAAFARATATPHGRVAAPLARMARGYRMHASVLGSVLGRLVAPPPEKERATPLFFDGPWGSFDRVLDEAVLASVPVLEATWAAFEANDRDIDRARIDLNALLPAGSIEGQGHDVDLARPFVPKAPREVDSIT